MSIFFSNPAFSQNRPNCFKKIGASTLASVYLIIFELN